MERIPRRIDANTILIPVGIETKDFMADGCIEITAEHPDYDRWDEFIRGIEQESKPLASGEQDGESSTDRP